MQYWMVGTVLYYYLPLGVHALLQSVHNTYGTVCSEDEAHPLHDSHVAVLQDLVWPIERLAGVCGEHESGGIVADNMAPTLKVW